MEGRAEMKSGLLLLWRSVILTLSRFRPGWYPEGKQSCWTSNPWIHGHLLCEAAKNTPSEEESFKKTWAQNGICGPGWSWDCFCDQGPSSPCPATTWTLGPPGYLKLQWWCCWLGGAVRSCCPQSSGTGCCRCSLSWQAARQHWAAGWGGWSPIPPPGPAAFSGPPGSTGSGSSSSIPEALPVQLHQNQWSPAHPRHHDALAPRWGLRNLFFSSYPVNHDVQPKLRNDLDPECLAHSRCSKKIIH